MIDLDRYVLQPCMAMWGRPVTYYSSTEPLLVPLAAFDDKYREETLQSMASLVVGARPMLDLVPPDYPVDSYRPRASCSLSSVTSTPFPTRRNPAGMATSSCSCVSRPTRKPSGSHDAACDRHPARDSSCAEGAAHAHRRRGRG